MQDISNPDAAFTLDPRLQADTFPVVDLALCRVLLMNDARWPWLILVPRRVGVVELFDLGADDRHRLADEAARVATMLKSFGSAEKTNVATLGNVVRAFHLHVVARSTGDPGWPGPVWGFGARLPYDEPAAEAILRDLRESLR
jgi:diadenosine tetraphosphate (Ap4A) HIT family hydrolase